MVSGQPPTQQPYQMYQPAYQPPHRSPGDMMKSMFLSNIMLGLAVGLGLLLMWVGALIWGFSNDSDVRNIGMAIKSLGMLALVGALLLGGMVRDDIEKWVRVTMIFSGALLLIFIGFWTGFWNAFGFSFSIPGLTI
jgi:hypothetical protein